MKSVRINPRELYESTRFGFSHAALDTGNGVIHLSGQVAWDAQCNLVGADDLALQTRQALANIKIVLAAAGSSIEDLVRLRTYIVNHDIHKLGVVTAELAGFYGDITPAPNTVIGVQALALPEFLIEIEATAVLP